MMRLDNPVLVPQHKQPSLLFWSASLVVNNEWRAQWRHDGNHPHFQGENKTWRESVSAASRHWSECAAPCKPRDKRTEVLHAFANGCSALFKNPFAVSWRLTQSSSSQQCTPPTNQQHSGNPHSLTKPQGILEQKHVWYPWHVHFNP